MKKTLEGEGTPFRRVSLLPPNLPHPPRTSPKSTRRCIAIICFALLWRVLLGEVLVWAGGGEFLQSAAIAHGLWVESGRAMQDKSVT